VAEGFLTVVDDLDNEIDELEDLVETGDIKVIGRRVRGIRHDLLGVRRTLSPTRDAVRKIVDNRIELDGGEVFPQRVEIAFGNAFDKLLRGSEGLDAARDALAGIRDYFQGKIAIDQNEVTKRLTAIASLLLVPTFIVGLYGQNFRNIPELHWGWGYWWSWGLIIATTIAQLVFYWRKRWL
jgi:Mg2+ and Co2+ transporter CorA